MTAHTLNQVAAGWMAWVSGVLVQASVDCVGDCQVLKILPGQFQICVAADGDGEILHSAVCGIAGQCLQPARFFNCCT